MASSINLVSKYIKDIEDFGEIATHRFTDFYNQCVKLRTSKNGKDKVRIVINSDSNIPAAYILAKTAKSLGTQDVCIVYAKTNKDDDGILIKIFLEKINAYSNNSKIDIYYANALKPNEIDMKDIVSDSTLIITFLANSYDFRVRLNEYATKLNYSIPEMPTLDIKACVSEAFSASIIEMKTSGNKIVDLVNKFKSFKIIAPDGTNLILTAGKFINEALNDFTYRPSDYLLNKHGLPTPIADNYPMGEVWANTHEANGTLVLYQIDDITGEGDEKFIYDPNDPIILTIKNSKIVKIKGSGRAKIFKEYLDERGIYDKDKGSGVDSPKLIAEIAWGINKGAKNPEVLLSNGTKTTSVLITEKVAKVPHIAFGNSPDVLSPDEKDFIHLSDTHIDNGLRNKNLQIFGILENGKKVLLTSTRLNEQGEIDKLIDNN